MPVKYTPELKQRAVELVLHAQADPATAHSAVTRIANELDLIEESRATGVEDTDENRNQFIARENQLASIDSEIKRLRQEAEFLGVDKKALEDDRRDVAKEKARLELESNELTAGQNAARQNKSSAGKKGRQTAGS